MIRMLHRLHRRVPARDVPGDLAADAVPRQPRHGDVVLGHAAARDPRLGAARGASPRPAAPSSASPTSDPSSTARPCSTRRDDPLDARLGRGDRRRRTQARALDRRRDHARHAVARSAWRRSPTPGSSSATSTGSLCHPMGGVPMLVPVDDRRGDRPAPDVRRHRRPRRRHRSRHGVAGGGRDPRRPGARRAVRDRGPAPAACAGQPRPRGQSLGRDTSAWAEFEVPFGNVGANVGYAMIANRYLHEHDCHAGAAGQDRRPPARQRLPQPRCLVLRPADHRRRRARLADGGRPAAPARDRDAVGRCRRPRRRAPRPRRRTPRTPPWLLGAGECVTHKTITYAPSLTETAIRPAADRAFAQAGVDPSAGRAGVAVRLLHDHRAGDAGGRRLLRAGRGRGVRRRARPALGRRLPAEHPRRPAQLQPAGHGRRHEPRDRGRPPGAGPRRRPPGRATSTWRSSTATAGSCPRSARCVLGVEP